MPLKAKNSKKNMINILIIDDDQDICLFFETVLQEVECRTYTANRLEEAKKINNRYSFDLVLLDLELPDGNGLDIIQSLMDNPSSPEVIIITGTGDARGAEMAFKYGAWDYVQKPFQLDDISLPIQRALKYRKEKLISRQRVPLVRTHIIGESTALRKCLEEVGKVASTDASVLITGETGTGKELFARAIHENSSRASMPFVAVDCGVLTETLIESTLFGHEKGAFTGASSKQNGLIVQANRGTLMLDEIGDMPLPIQKTFLRTLQEKSVRTIGGTKEIPVDIRLISATNLDLDEMVQQNLFREDLLYRIRAMEIHLPSLRERKEDIELIVLKKVHDLSVHYKITTKAVSPEFLDILSENNWPGNIRQLINVLEYALASAKNDPTLVPKHLPPQYRISSLTFTSSNENAAKSMVGEILKDNQPFPQLFECREALEKTYLKKLMNKVKGDRKNACGLSGLSQARLYALLKKYDLPGFSSHSS